VIQIKQELEINLLVNLFVDLESRWVSSTLPMESELKSSKQSYKKYFLLFCWVFGIWGNWSLPIAALEINPVSHQTNQTNQTNRSGIHQNKSNCPQDLVTLTNLLLQDLPSYTNRLIQRSIPLDPRNPTRIYMVTAGNPEFNPITTDLNSVPDNLNNPLLNPSQGTNSPENSELQQVFFTTLNREYQGNRLVENQEFHRLFLVQTNQGWQLALMYSRSSLSPQLLTPPRDSLNSAVGQAVKIWLRDCQAGAIDHSEQ
jgi:hypothetical protein